MHELCTRRVVLLKVIQYELSYNACLHDVFTIRTNFHDLSLGGEGEGGGWGVGVGNVGERGGTVIYNLTDVFNPYFAPK